MSALYDTYWGLIRRGAEERDAMDRLGLQPWRYCCRATLLTWVPDDGGARETKAPPNGSKFHFRSTDMAADETVSVRERELLCR